MALDTLRWSKGMGLEQCERRSQNLLFLFRSLVLVARTNTVRETLEFRCRKFHPAGNTTMEMCAASIVSTSIDPISECFRLSSIERAGKKKKRNCTALCLHYAIQMLNELKRTAKLYELKMLHDCCAHKFINYEKKLLDRASICNGEHLRRIIIRHEVAASLWSVVNSRAVILKS